MPQRTPLYADHLAANARMVDFSGWEMPIHYGSQIEEHHAVRRDAGLFDVSHMCAVDVTGTDAAHFLRHLLANDIAKLTTSGRALYSCLLNEQGSIIDDLIVYFFAPTNYRLVVNAGTAEKDIAWMQAQRAGFSIDITPRREGAHALAMLAIQGPQAREKFWAAFPASRPATESLSPFQAAEWQTDNTTWLIARTGYTGEDGFEITLPAALASMTWQALIATGAKPCGLGARDTLRLEAGMNLYGQDMDETRSPDESNLAWTVDLRDASRDFIGKSALARRRESHQTTHQLTGLLLLERGILRAHQKVFTALGEGEITSGTFSPTLNQSIAFARLPVDVAVGEEVSVAIRDKQLAARVVKFPFVRNGKSLLPSSI
ncbi:MAG: glycine cleavage system aminomethyltransferase GcvT [Rhodocyclales bacterium]|nr:glycine cleavage system aminomethyltransferase GcvT [Rhodocyclales bacterium]